MKCCKILRPHATVEITPVVSQFAHIQEILFRFPNLNKDIKERKKTVEKETLENTISKLSLVGIVICIERPKINFTNIPYPKDIMTRGKLNALSTRSGPL